MVSTFACGLDQRMPTAQQEDEHFEVADIVIGSRDGGKLAMHEDLPELTSVLTSAATLENGLPYDWCTWLVAVGEKEYTPSDATIAKVEAFTHNAIGKTKATIEYRVTGIDKTVRCGWNGTVERPEIEILSIR